MTEGPQGEFRRVGEAFRLLGRPMRRRVLAELARYDGPVGVDELTAAVTRSGTARGEAVPVDATDADAVRVALYHEHLPTLAEAGWIEYDSDGRTARCRLRPDVVRPALRAAVDDLEAVRARVEEVDAP